METNYSITSQVFVFCAKIFLFYFIFNFTFLIFNCSLLRYV